MTTINTQRKADKRKPKESELSPAEYNRGPNRSACYEAAAKHQEEHRTDPFAGQRALSQMLNGAAMPHDFAPGGRP